MRTLEGELSEAMAEIERLENEVTTLESELAEAQRKTGEGVAVEAPAETTYEATHYTAYCDGCSGVTYSGHDLRQSIYDAEGRRIVAVDPSVIPLGSTLEISYADGTTFEAIASDIGGDIKGKRIDIAVKTKDEAYRLGRQDVSVRILNEGER